MGDYSKLPPGDHTVEETDAYTRNVRRWAGGWDETIVWKPGYEPEAVASTDERLAALEARHDALLGKLEAKDVLTKADLVEVADAAIEEPGR